MKARALVVTCEHGGNRIPRAYARCFAGHEAALASHEGHDPGALELARDLQRRFDAPLVYSTTSRLLVELNRSPGHPQLYSRFTRALPEDEKRELCGRHYLPYRHDVERCVTHALRRCRQVVHVSSHSFTPVLDGKRRKADVGLLYDPSRAPERDFCLAWQAGLKRALPQLVIRRNYPYRGTADGLTTHLRRRFAQEGYLGIEIEVNQKHALGDARAWRELRSAIAASLAQALTGKCE